MPGYTPLFGDIVTSSIWDENSDTRCVWITMLALADKNGYVSGSIPGLARLAKVPIEICKKALDIFAAPDLYSRSKKNEGRRIAIADGGWFLLNYVDHREKARLRNAEYYRNWRKNNKNSEIESKSATVAQRCATSFEVAPDAIKNGGKTQKLNQKAQLLRNTNATEAQRTTNNKQQTTNNNINIKDIISNNNIPNSIEGASPKTDIVVSNLSQKNIVVSCGKLLQEITTKKEYWLKRLYEIYPNLLPRQKRTLNKLTLKMECFAMKKEDVGIFSDVLVVLQKSTEPKIRNRIGYIVGSIQNLIE